MGWFRSGAAVLLALWLAAPASRAGAEGEAPARAFKSVYGKLQSVDKSLRGVVMKSDAGERLAWRFSAAVVEEAARFKPGDPMIVIYRLLGPKDKRVTALAFPGAASVPTYLNTTGATVELRGAPAVGEVCGQPDAGPASQSTVPGGGRAEVMDACWCCAPSGETCTPGNKTGAGIALLVSCFK